ncbi:Integrator 6 [Strongyloides ratti]|uniref:Integrator 6 n=1 Tax=Strongyloides ratti TaxID=34506 RepID=A0A090LMB3_STRRB|nr:Integrator 6 [Strongyloides ratti]CEF69313.1 Integrator 6 [Strongyloides ratti]
MVCFVFLVDNSASMAARTWKGTTLLDEAKVWIDSFVKARLKDQVFSKVDKFLLYTSEEAVRHQKVILKDSGLLFFDQLRLIKPCGRANFPGAAEQIFNYIHLTRKLNGCDRFGYGRSPQLLHDTVIIHVTDGLSVIRGEGLTINQTADSLQEFYDQPFRWDQKFFTLVFRISGIAPTKKQYYQISNIECDPYYEPFCQSVGGRSFVITHVGMLNTITEHIFHRAGCVGAFVKFDLAGFSFSNEIDKKNITKSLKTQPVLIREHRNLKVFGGWLIPENFWPGDVKDKFPTRPVNPTLVTRSDNSFNFTDSFDFPFDKYELEPCLLSNIMLKTVVENSKNSMGNSNPSSISWPVYVENSGPRRGTGEPIGFLKPNFNLSAIHLYLGPYNFFALDSLMKEWKVKGYRLDGDLNTKFERYLRETPMYYHNILKKQMKAMKLTLRSLEDGNGFTTMSSYPPRVVNILHKIKESGRKEMEDVNKSVNDSYQACVLMSLGLNQIQSQQPIPYPISYSKHSIIPSLLDEKNAMSTSIGKMIDAMNAVKDLKKLRFDFSSNPSYSPFKNSHCYKNAYALRRSAIEMNNNSTLLDQTLKVMTNYELICEEKSVTPFCGGVPGEVPNLCNIEEWQSQRIQGMGDYDSYSNKRIQLGHKINMRDPFEEINGKTNKIHEFGNPFKSDKKAVIDIDEVPEEKDDIENGMNGSNLNGKRLTRQDINKKRKGPLDLERVLSFYRKQKNGNFGIIRNDGYISDASTDFSDTESLSSTDSAFSSRSSSPIVEIDKFNSILKNSNNEENSNRHRTLIKDDIKKGLVNSFESMMKMPKPAFMKTVEDYKQLKMVSTDDDYLKPLTPDDFKPPPMPPYDTPSNKMVVKDRSQTLKVQSTSSTGDLETVNSTSPKYGSNTKISPLNLLSAKPLNNSKRCTMKSIYNPAAEAIEIKKKKLSTSILLKSIGNDEKGKQSSGLSLNNSIRKRQLQENEMVQLKQKVEEYVRVIDVDETLYDNIISLLKETSSFSDFDILYKFSKRELTRFNKRTICSKLEENVEKIKQKKRKVDSSKVNGVK